MFLFPFSSAHLKHTLKASIEEIIQIKTIAQANYLSSSINTSQISDL